MTGACWLSIVVALVGWTTACSGARGHTPRPEWHSAIQRDHPLTGELYDVAAARTVTRKDLDRALESADVVLIGEQHDNVDHHSLQRGILRGIAGGGRRPAVVFEQLDLDRQEAIDAALAALEDAPVAERAGAIAEAVSWQTSGWPSFDMYRPVFETALEENLPVRAANLSREKLRAGFAGSSAGSSAELAALSAQALETLEADIVESHCGHAPKSMVDAMIAAQRRRDAAIAGVVVDALGPAAHGAAEREGGGAVVICGFGHARKDYGVPVALGELLPKARVVSIGLLEVVPGVAAPGEYATLLHAGRLPFDYVLFTPRASDEDPCEKFRASLEKMKKR